MESIRVFFFRGSSFEERRGEGLFSLHATSWPGVPPRVPHEARVAQGWAVWKGWNWWICSKDPPVYIPWEATGILHFLGVMPLCPIYLGPFIFPWILGSKGRESCFFLEDCLEFQPPMDG